MNVRAAKGLTKLTWSQIEKIDLKVSSLCALTSQTENSEARLVLVIRRGKLRFAEMRVSEELSPV